ACRGGLRRRRLLRAVRHLVQAVVRECGERAVAGGEGHDRHGRGAAGGGRRRGRQPDEEEGRGEGSRERSSDRWQGGFSESGGGYWALESIGTCRHIYRCHTRHANHMRHRWVGDNGRAAADERGRMSQDRHDFTRGSPLRQLVAFSTPVMVANLLQTSYQLVDSLWVGNLLGAAALGAVAVSGTVVFTVLSFVIGMNSAALTILSQ